MSNPTEQQKKRFILTPRARAAALAGIERLESQKAVSSSRPNAAVGLSQPIDLAAPRRTEVPEEYLSVESRALSFFDENPLFSTCGAAQILAVTVELLKKWRQRNLGPDYLQYGTGGPVRYELNALMAFRDAHRIKVSPMQ